VRGRLDLLKAAAAPQRDELRRCSGSDVSFMARPPAQIRTCGHAARGFKKCRSLSSFFGSFREAFVIVYDPKHFLFRCFVF
jgi:hypothetical protein